MPIPPFIRIDTTGLQRLAPYIKDQILGHAADNVSHLYTNVQQPLIEAINTMPAPQR